MIVLVGESASGNQVLKKIWLIIMVIKKLYHTLQDNLDRER